MHVRYVHFSINFFSFLSGCLFIQEGLGGADVASLVLDLRLASVCCHCHWKRPCFLSDCHKKKSSNHSQLGFVVSCSGRLWRRCSELSHLCYWLLQSSIMCIPFPCTQWVFLLGLCINNQPLHINTGPLCCYLKTFKVHHHYDYEARCVFGSCIVDPSFAHISCPLPSIETRNIRTKLYNI